MADYTPEQMKDMLSFMKANPDMVTAEMKTMMGDAIGSAVQSAAYETKIASMSAEITSLKSSVSDPNKRIIELESALKAKNSATADIIKSTIDARIEALTEEIKSKEELAMVSKSLSSVMKRSNFEKLMARNPPLQELKSTLEILTDSGLVARVGVGIGTLSSSEEQKYNTAMQKMNIPEINFSGGR